MQFGFNVDNSPGCCGVSQIHGFSDEFDDYHDYGYGLEFLAKGDTAEEAYKNLFDVLMNYNPKPNHDGQVFQIWFQKSVDYKGDFAEHYVAEPLRLLVETIPNVMNLGEYVNYKSGNKIQGYQWEQQI